MTAADTVLARLKQGHVRPRDLAVALRVKRSAASLMLRGKRGIPIWHLDAIAALLQIEVPQLVDASDLIRHSTQDNESFGGGSDAPTAAHLRELEAKAAAFDALARELDAIIKALTTATESAILRAEGGEARVQPASRSRHHRKAGGRPAK